MLNTARVVLPGLRPKFCELRSGNETVDEMILAGGGTPNAPGTMSLLDGAPAGGGTTVRPGQTVQQQPVARNG